MSDPKTTTRKPADEPSDGPMPQPAGRRSKFGAAAEGWDAYNDWLGRVRQQPAPTSRQAVISKALYSVSSYKNWADKARDAFEKAK